MAPCHQDLVTEAAEGHLSKVAPAWRPILTWASKCHLTRTVLVSTLTQSAMSSLRRHAEGEGTYCPQENKHLEAEEDNSRNNYYDSYITYNYMAPCKRKAFFTNPLRWKISSMHSSRKNSVMNSMYLLQLKSFIQKTKLSLCYGYSFIKLLVLT